MQKTITVPEVGEVLITKKTNASRLKLRIHPAKGVLVTIPYRVSFDEGELFVLKNIEWLKKKLNALAQRKDEQAIFAPGCEFTTRSLQLVFIAQEIKGIRARLDDDKICIYYNSSVVDFNDEQVQSFISGFILKCLKREGEKYLINRARILSEKTGLKFKSIKVGTAGTRLGSCSSRNDIILSARLMLLSDELIDYIILHEFSHIVHKNHSERFHGLLNSLVNGKSKELNSQLRKQSIVIKPGDFRYDKLF
jgi:predicted metal-dependent hydrolase